MVSFEEKPPHSRWLLLLVGAGLTLRLWQYLGNPSLWVDELALARNLLDRSAVELFLLPFSNGVSAPIGFVLLEKGIVALFGASELALRLLPISAAIAALPLFLALAGRVLPPRAIVPALALFALAPPLTLRGAEVKQYSTDVLVALALTLCVLRWLESPGRGRTATLALLATVAPWVSQPALFLVGGLLGLGLSTARRLPRSQPAGGLWFMVPAALSAGLAAWYLESMVTGVSRAMLFDNWNRGLMPWQPRAALDWLVHALPEPFRWEDFGLAPVAAYLYTALVPVGWVRLWRRDVAPAAMIGTFLLIPLLGGMAHLYPFADRLVLFLAPFVCLTLGAAFAELGNRVARWHPLLGPAAVVALLSPVGFVAYSRRPVIRRHEARPVLAELARLRQPGDPLYVFFTGWLAYDYYGPRLGLDPREVRIGRCAMHQPTSYYAELNRYAGRPRVWVFFTHEPINEREQILAHLDSVGTRTFERVVERWPPSPRWSASLFRYDLSRASRTGDTLLPSALPQTCPTSGAIFPVERIPRSGLK